MMNDSITIIIKIILVNVWLYSCEFEITLIIYIHNVRITAILFLIEIFARILQCNINSKLIIKFNGQIK